MGAETFSHSFRRWQLLFAHGAFGEQTSRRWIHRKAGGGVQRGRQPGEGARPAVTSCPGCALALPQVSGPTHRYVGASAACWSLYGEVLASIYGDRDRRRLLQLVVDSYAVQHPGSPGRQAAQSVAIHLMTLCLCVEYGRDPADGPRLHKAMVERPAFTWLEPPSSRGSYTIRDVADAGTNDEYESAVWRWARDVWHAWSAHHATIKAWLRATRAAPAAT